MGRWKMPSEIARDGGDHKLMEIAKTVNSGKAGYVSNLQRLAMKQISAIPNSEYSYRYGVDFLTNSPVYRKRENSEVDARRLKLSRLPGESLQGFCDLIKEGAPEGMEFYHELILQGFIKKPDRIT